jgi:hypothetical protein
MEVIIFPWKKFKELWMVACRKDEALPEGSDISTFKAQA